MSLRPTADEMLERLFEAVPGGLVHVAEDGAVVRANPEACRFLSIGFDELTERYTQDFEGDTWFEDGRRCPVDAYPVTVALQERRPAGPTTIGVTQRDGSVRWAVFRAVPIEADHVLVTFLDITERRWAEQRLRTADRLASLGRLAAGVSKAVRQPLTWVSLQLERALRGDGVEASLVAAQDGVDQVSAMVRDLGAFVPPDVQPSEALSLIDALEHALVIARPQLEALAHVEVDRPAELPSVAGVSLRLEQVLIDLLLNAAEAPLSGPRAEHRVVVAFGRDGVGAWVEVRDNGQGMDHHTLEHALDPFFTTKASPRSKGLGLAISQALTQAMDGRLEVRSEVGEGTTARLWLPLAHSAPQPRPPTRAAGGPRQRILVVDDEPASRTAVTWALSSHEVVVADRGTEALALLERSVFNVMVCDLMMPHMTGMELYARLCDAGHPLRERILFITGGAYTEEARAFVSRDDVRVLAKPFRARALRDAIDGLCGA